MSSISSLNLRGKITHLGLGELKAIILAQKAGIVPASYF